LLVGLVQEKEEEGVVDASEEVRFDLVEDEDAAGSSRLEDGFGDGSLVRW
jgi:hypothetical protein